jgi:hypothetical protein
VLMFHFVLQLLLQIGGSGVLVQPMTYNARQ